MKSSLLLSGVLLLSAPVLALSQTSTQPLTNVATEPNGYELLVQAGKAILPGPNGGASATTKLSATENLKNERLAVARNAPALALVRRALQKPIEMPEVVAGEDNLEFQAKVRELGRRFSQESDVRFADGDFEGAMNSRLDAIELGAAVGHGVLISLLVGLATEAIGSKDADKVAAHLNAKQCRAAIVRLSAIEARRTSLAETLRQEQKHTLKMVLETVSPVEGIDIDSLVPSADGKYPTAADIALLQALKPERITANNSRLFNAAVEMAQLPYPQAIKFSLPQDLDEFSQPLRSLLQDAKYLFSFNRTVAQSRLLRTALKLRIQKLETGKYPSSLATPLDPFSPAGKPLVYRKSGSDYLLYSVGPDGRDDGGAELQTPLTQPESGLTIVSDRLLPNATGDIVQLPF